MENNKKSRKQKEKEFLPEDEFISLALYLDEVNQEKKMEWDPNLFKKSAKKKEKTIFSPSMS